MHRRVYHLSLVTITLLSLHPSSFILHPSESALAQASTSQDRKTEADRLFQQGVQQYRQGGYPKALSTYQRVLEIQRQLNDKAGIGQTLNNIGEVYYWLRQPDKALEVLQQALAIRRELKDRTGEGETLDNIGLSYFWNNQNDKALETLQQALAIRREVQDKAGESKTLSNLGTLYLGGFQQYPQALESLQQAMAIQQELGDKFLLGITLRRLGTVYRAMKNYPRTLEWLEKSLALSREVQNRAGEGETLYQIGVTYFNQEKYDQALQFYQQALPFIREAGIRSIEASILLFIGKAYSLQGNEERKVELYQQGLAIQREINDKPAQLSTLRLLSYAYSSKAGNLSGRELYAQAKVEYTRSMELAQEVIALARELKNREIEANGLNNLGYAYTFFRDNQKAIEVFQQGINIAREIKALDAEASALTGLASVYLNQENIRKALEINLRLSEIHREQNDSLQETSSLITAASNYNQLGEAQKALELSQQALAIARKIDANQIAPNLRYGVLQVELFALERLSSSYNALGNLNKALDFAQQAVNRAQGAGKPNYQVTTLLNLARLYSSEFQDFPKAIEIGQQALTISRQIKEPQLEGNALEKLSDFYTKQGNQTLALESAEELLTIAKRVESPTLEQNALMLLYNVYRNQGNYQKALEFGQQYLALAQTKKTGYEAVGFMNLSQSYIDIGNPNKALEISQQLLTLARQESNSFYEGAALTFTSLALKFQGKYDEGVKTGQQAVEIARKINNFSLEASATVELIRIYEALGEFQNVITLAKPILPRIKQLDNPVLEANALMIVGNAYGSIGDYTKGKDLLDQGLEIVRRLKNPAQESRGLMLLGRLSSSLGDYQQALTQTQQSLQIAQKLQYPFLQIEPLYTLGGIYNSLGDYDSSAKYYQQALAIAQQFNNRYNEGIALLNLGYISFAQGNPQETVEFSQKALTIFQDIKEPRLEAFTHRMLSFGYGELGNDAKAMEAAQNFLTFARKTQNSVWKKMALSLLGGLHSKFGRKEQAIAAYQQAQAIGDDAYIYAGLARIYRDLNQPNVAIGYYKQSVNKIEEVRRNIQGLPTELQKSFLEATVDFDRVKISDIYRQLAALLLSQGRDKEALQVQQLMREQEIREAISPRGTTGDKPNIPLTPAETKISPQSESIIALAKQINECESTNCSQLQELTTRRTSLIAEFDQQLQKIDQEIRANRAKDDAFFDPNKLAKAQEIVEAQPGTVMIYPLVLENELWLQLYAQGGAVKTVKVSVTRDELGKAVKEFRDLMKECEKVAICGSAEATKVQAVSQKLYNWLMKDLEVELQNKNSQVKNLVFALDRVTRYIPMSALYDGKQYLIEKYTIYNVLTEDTDTREKLPVGPQNSPVLAMGLSDAVPGFGPLPNVPAEINAIVRQETKNNQGIYPGQKFLNRAFDFATLQDNLKGYRILHLATHGVFVPDSADKSYILLGTGEQLTIPQIKTLTGLSNIHLVVLSACQTALAGPRQDGIEIASMAYHFLNRGAKAVMASLWLVDDGSTSLLMQQFYKNLANGTSENPMTKAEALRQAQLNLLQGNVSTAANTDPRGGIIVEQIPGSRPPITPSNGSKFSHPYYWAPFILIGNGL
ncbi:MAG: tetratricopeptide repeat protein [Cyanobacteriota bacterium]